jgi:hypothetical protein
MDPLDTYLYLLRNLSQTRESIEEVRDLVFDQGEVVGYEEFVDALLNEMTNVSYFLIFVFEIDI